MHRNFIFIMSVILISLSNVRADEFKCNDEAVKKILAGDPVTVIKFESTYDIVLATMNQLVKEDKQSITEKRVRQLDNTNYERDFQKRVNEWAKDSDELKSCTKAYNKYLTDHAPKASCEEITDQYTICNGVRYVRDTASVEGLKRDVKKIDDQIKSNKVDATNSTSK